jgi:large subunit ribosomal protein L22
MEIKAKAKFIRMSPRKIRLVADLIRGMDVGTALDQLNFTVKAAKEPILKLLNSCIANATNNFKLKKENLYIKTITVDGGSVLKRWQPKAFGRATPIRKRSSHISIILSDKTGVVFEKEKPKEDIVLKPTLVESLKSFNAEKSREEEKIADKKGEKGKAQKEKEIKQPREFLKKFFNRKTG